jgi:hypothetical protein
MVEREFQMTLNNWIVTAHLISPLCGEPPMIDSLLEYELSLRLGYKMARKLTRNVPLSQIEHPPIPLAKRTIVGIDFYCSSNPIIGNVFADYTERQSKRFDTDMCVLMIDERYRKKLLTSSGPYKSRFVPIRVRVIDTINWIVRGDRKEMNKLLKKIIALGTERSYGYGRIGGWEYEEIEDDYSIFAMHQGKKVLMKTLPIEVVKAADATGYRNSFGGAFPPYWHPETYMEIGIPC